MVIKDATPRTTGPPWQRCGRCGWNVRRALGTPCVAKSDELGMGTAIRIHQDPFGTRKKLTLWSFEGNCFLRQWNACFRICFGGTGALAFLEQIDQSFPLHTAQFLRPPTVPIQNSVGLMWSVSLVKPKLLLFQCLGNLSGSCSKHTHHWPRNGSKPLIKE